MPRGNRAAQFAPFAALTGYDDAIDETVRQTDAYIELDESEAEALDRKLQFLRALFPQKTHIRLTYFKPDECKAGGAYITAEGTAEALDIDRRILVLTDRTAIPLDRICTLDGECFSEAQLLVD